MVQRFVVDDADAVVLVVVVRLLFVVCCFLFAGCLMYVGLFVGCLLLVVRQVVRIIQIPCAWL